MAFGKCLHSCVIAFLCLVLSAAIADQAHAQTIDQCLDRGGSIYECRDPDLGRWEHSAAGPASAVGPYGSLDEVMAALEAALRSRWPCGMQIVSVSDEVLNGEWLGHPFQYRRAVLYRVLRGGAGEPCAPPTEWSEGMTFAYKQRRAELGGTWLRCPGGYRFLSALPAGSEPAVCGRERIDGICSYGNPVNPGTRTKHASSTDFVHAASPLLSLDRYYDSQGFKRRGVQPSTLFPGYRWRSGFDRTLTVTGPADSRTAVHRAPNGTATYFRESGGRFAPVLSAADVPPENRNGSKLEPISKCLQQD